MTPSPSPQPNPIKLEKAPLLTRVENRARICPSLLVELAAKLKESQDKYEIIGLRIVAQKQEMGMKIEALEVKLKEVEKERGELRDKIENYEYPRLKAINDRLLSSLNVTTLEAGLEVIEQYKRRKIKVGVFGILERGGKVLLGLRSSKDTSFPNCWCHPGGGIEFGETVDCALEREFLEEVVLETSPVQSYLAIHEWFGNSRHVILIFKAIESVDLPMCGDGFSEIGWFTIEEIRQLHAVGKTTPLTIVAAENWTSKRILEEK